ncbi:MAG TPA: UDP-N-acetylmuramoyl-L-alanine--D-glutamate ligase [Fimbriimonadaceae bacterium]|nr:UDP-N-acetylmuramoyl-L-alanine--D-glutamate ligase [Fimbriimonadaceae bacterium]
MEGKRVAIYGLGRSGLAIARACLALGAIPTVYDKALPEQMVKQDVLESVRELGIDLHLGWEGRFDPASLDWLVTNPGVDMRSAVLQQAKADGIEILSEVEFAYRISKAPIVAITGTNGKSTTTVMTYLALRECGIDAVLCGNIFGSGLPEVPLTEAALHSTPDQVLVAEISSFQLEWVSRFCPAVAGITNIAPDHLDRYDSFQQYAETKMRIFAAQGVGDYAVVRAFDPVVRLGSAQQPARRLRRGAAFQAVSLSGFQPEEQRLEASETHRLEGDATGRATVYTFGAQGEHAQVLEEEIRILDKVIRTQDIQVIGTHNYANAAMAGLMAYATLRWLAERPMLSDQEVQATTRPSRALLREAEGGYERKRASKRTVYSGRQSSSERAEIGLALPEPIVTALKAFKGIEHRMEYLGSKNGVRIINNSMCTNPEAVVRSAQAVKGPNHLIMGGKDKDLPFAPVKNYLANGMHKAYLYGEAKEVLNTQLGGRFPTYNTLQEAFRAATEKARPGEVIMLAPGCASTDQFHDFRDRGNVFKKIAKEWLES